MTIRLLLITHEEIGQALMKATNTMLAGKIPLATTVISINATTDIEKLTNELDLIIKNTASNNGILILTDLYGATPSNIATSLGKYPYVSVVSGLNLSMLIRVMNYANLALPELTKKALSGGKEGILNCLCGKNDNN